MENVLGEYDSDESSAQVRAKLCTLRLTPLVVYVQRSSPI